MSESSALISAFVHGLAAGAALLMGLTVARSGLGRDVRLATGLATVSIAAWLVNESQPLWQALGQPWPVALLACAVAGLFWLFLLTVFADWRVTPLTLLPAAVLLVSGEVMYRLADPLPNMIWAGRNLAAAGLALHAAVVILRGWQDDLVERRRRFRALILVLACGLVLVEVTAAFGYRIEGDPAWLTVAVGHPVGGGLVALLAFALCGIAVQVQPSAFGAPKRLEATDARAEVADRHLLQQLEAAMTGEAWRREGLTIGSLATELGVPEHRLRRLINQRLGHRNFADFVNGYRIQAAQARLADPAQARTTIAAVAFDLGFGSLGPFNRAFRAETGLTPTEWRRQALGEASPKPNEAA